MPDDDPIGQIDDVMRVIDCLADHLGDQGSDNFKQRGVKLGTLAVRRIRAVDPRDKFGGIRFTGGRLISGRFSRGANLAEQLADHRVDVVRGRDNQYSALWERCQ